jgi:hypothetical protein
MFGDGAGVGISTTTGITFMRSDRINSPSGASSLFGTAVIDLFDVSSTSVNKTIRSIGGTDNNGSGFIGIGGAVWANTSPITSITLLPADAGNLATYSSFALYGVK